MITVNPGEAINFDTGEVEKIDPPTETKTEETSDKKDVETENLDAKKSDDTPKKEGEEEETTSESEEEEEEEEEKEEEEEGAEEAKSTDKKEGESEEEEEEEVVAIDSYLAEKYADREIKSEEDLDATLAAIDEIQEENETLRAEITELKKASTAPKFDSEAEEKAYNFVKNFGVDRLGEGMQTYANLITMDVEKAEPKILLEEQFILENPELTRDEALRKFNRDYQKRYTVNKDDFDTDEAFKEAQEDKRIDLKADAAKAKKFIQQKQVEFKPKAKEAGNNAPQISEAVQKSIKAHDSELESFVKEFDTLIFSPTDNEKDDFVFKLTKAQVKEVQEAAQGWIRNPNSYDAKGNLIGFTDIDNKIHQISYMLFGPDLIEKALKHGLSKGEIKRAEEIAKKKPTRTSKVASTAPDVSEEKQWEDLAKQKKSGKVFA